MEFKVSVRTWKEATSEVANAVVGSRVHRGRSQRKEKTLVLDVRGQRSEWTDCRTS